MLCHKNGLLHRDVKPSNIIFRSRSSFDLVLIDFGIAKQFKLKKRQSFTVCYSNGYSPREQYSNNEFEWGPWSDIYSLGATLYYLLTKEILPSAIHRSDDDLDHQLDQHYRISKAVRTAISKAVALNHAQRCQSIEEWLMILNQPKPSFYWIDPISWKSAEVVHKLSDHTEAVNSVVFLDEKIPDSTGFYV
jgi:serine/threonine-protein kinase